MAALRSWNHRRLSLISLARCPLQILMPKPQRLEHTAAGSHWKEEESSSAAPQSGFSSSMWKIVDSRSLGICYSQVDSSVLSILKLLKKKGFGAYLVGGCVRDLLLHKPPKDFDVITTANLKQVRKQFRKTMIVGRRFPVCLVFIKGASFEVSSFGTVSKNSVERQKVTPQIDAGCDPEDLARWKNCMRRDFTINSLLYDPYSNKLYDYVNGLNDMSALKVCTVAPACVSFTEDCARILRGVRIAARLGLDFSKETEVAILDLSSSIRSLSKARLLMEMDYMLAYGAAVPSILLLQRFKLLEILLPFQAAYLAHHEASEAGQSSSLLMKLFSGLDKLLAADHPSDCKLWLALLAFHLALMKCQETALTIWTFCSIMCYGDRMKAIKFAKAIFKNTNYFPEILCSSEAKPDDLLLEDASRFASTVKSSLCCFTCSDDLIKVLERYPQSSPFIGMVFVSKNMATKVRHVFDIFCDERNTALSERRTYSIDYGLLKKGDVNETRFALGKVIMDVLCSGINNERKQAWVKDVEGRNKTQCALLENDQNEAESQIKELDEVYNEARFEENEAIAKRKKRKLQSTAVIKQKKRTLTLKRMKEKKPRYKPKKRKLTLKRTKEKKPRHKPLKVEKNVSSGKEIRQTKGRIRKMENFANLRQHKQNLVRNMVEHVGNFHSGKGMKQKHTNAGSKVKILTALKRNRRGSSRNNGIKQERNHDDVDRGGNRSQTVTSGGKSPQLSKLFR